MKKFKKEDNEVSIKSSTKFSKNCKQGRRHKPKIISRKSTFEGRVEEIKGHIYNCSDTRQADSYTNTIMEIVQYVGTKYKYGEDIRYLVENLKAPILNIPDYLSNTATLSDFFYETRDIGARKAKNITMWEFEKLYLPIWGQCFEYM